MKPSIGSMRLIWRWFGATGLLEDVVHFTHAPLLVRFYTPRRFD